MRYSATMPRHPAPQGDLQAQIMSALWRIGHGTVEQVRESLPARYQGAYTTVQTVLNRMAERGVLIRRKEGRAVVYTPRFSEAEHVERSIEQTLAGASAPVREAALARLIGRLDADQLDELQRLAREVDAARAEGSGT